MRLTPSPAQAAEAERLLRDVPRLQNIMARAPDLPEDCADALVNVERASCSLAAGSCCSPLYGRESRAVKKAASRC